MIAVQHPGAVFQRPRVRRALQLAPAIARPRTTARRATALLMLVAILNTVGGSGLLLCSVSPFALQSRASALQARWGEMVAEGVPASDLSALRQQLAGAQRKGMLAAGLVIVWPNSTAILNAWQAQTDAIWGRNITTTRSSAVAADEKLRLALGYEPSEDRKERAAMLAASSTPADFRTLSSDWNLEAELVPIDREIAAQVGKVIAVSALAKAQGILSDPARDVLAEAHVYAFALGPERITNAGQLSSDLALLVQDLNARLAAAGITTSGFARAAREISRTKSFGVSVARFTARVAAVHKSYSIATKAGHFTALTAELKSIAFAAHHAGQVALAAMHSAHGDQSVHIISGVPLYYQIHSLSCEETATSMGLRHQGLHISQDQILARLGVDWTPARMVNGRVVRWGNPDRAFVGNVNGSESNYTGQQANPKALVHVLNSYGARIIEWSEPGVGPNVISAQEIYKQVRLGHPVVAYATWDWNWHPIYYYTSEDGNRVPLISPANDHVYLVVGVSAYRVLVNDPIRGQYWVSKAAFQASYEFGMAIVLQ